MKINEIQRQWLVLIFIFLVNFFLKLILIADASLWYDEIISVKDTLLDFGHIKHEAEWDKNPPFYHYVLWVWSKLFGISVFSVRSMSALFSSLTACLIYKFTFNYSDKFKALFAVLVFTVHPYLFYYAQEARCYSFLIFLVMVNLIVLSRVISEPNYKNTILLGVLNFLIFYTHYIAGIILFCQFLFLMVIFKNKLKYLLNIYLTPILLVFLRFTQKQYKVIFLSGESSKQKANVPLSSIEGLINATPKLFFSNLILVIFVVLVIIIMIRNHDKFKVKNGIIYYIIFTPIISILILFGLGYLTNVFDSRYLIFTTPFIVIGISQLIDDKRLATFFLILVLVFELQDFSFNKSKKMDYKFAAYLSRKVENKENVPIYIQSADVVTLFLYYYDFQAFRLLHNPELLNKIKMSSGDVLKSLNITVINTKEDFDLSRLKFENKFLLLQTYQKKNDELKIDKMLDSIGFKNYTTRSIEGIKFNYFSKKETKEYLHITSVK